MAEPGFETLFSDPKYDPQPSALEKIFANKNLINLLAGIGAGIDPHGVGGILGKPTQAFVSAQAASEREDKRAAQVTAQNKHQQLAAKMLGDYGGFSPLEQPGVNKLEVTPQGTLRMDVTPPPQVEGSHVGKVAVGDEVPIPPELSAPVVPAAPAAPAAQVAPTTPATTIAPTPGAGAPRVTSQGVMTAAEAARRMRTFYPLIPNPVDLGPGTLSGLSPQEIAQVMHYEQGAEQQRNQTVMQLIGAQGAEVGLGERQAKAELDTQQGARLSALLPGAAAEQAATTEAHAAAAALNRYSVKAGSEKLGGEIAHTAAGTANIIQNTAVARATLDKMTSLQEGEVTALRLKNEGAVTANQQAELQLENQKLLGNVPVEIQQEMLRELREKKKDHIEIKVPTAAHPEGEPVRVTGAEILHSLSTKGASGQAAQNHADMIAHQKAEFDRHEQGSMEHRRKTSNDAEAVILGSADGVENKTSPAVIANIDTYNSTSEKPYIYHWEGDETRGWYNPNAYNPLAGTSRKGAVAYTIPKIKPESVGLPKGPDIQLNARQITKMATPNGLTPFEYMVGILKLTPKEKK